MVSSPAGGQVVDEHALVVFTVKANDLVAVFQHAAVVRQDRQRVTLPIRHHLVAVRVPVDRIG